MRGHERAHSAQREPTEKFVQDFPTIGVGERKRERQQGALHQAVQTSHRKSAQPRGHSHVRCARVVFIASGTHR